MKVSLTSHSEFKIGTTIGDDLHDYRQVDSFHVVSSTISMAIIIEMV